MDLLSNILIYLIIGSFAGIMAGALGIGGGLIVVPGLLFLFQVHELIPKGLSMHFASGSSLAIMILTAQASLRAHLKLGEVLWPVYKKLWPGLIIGTMLGGLLANQMPTGWLKFIFAVFLLLMATKMLMDTQVNRLRHFPTKWINDLVNMVIGVQSGLLGIGGGLLIVPYLTYCGIDPRKIAAVTNLCTLTVGLVGTVVFMMTGLTVMTHVPYSTGYIYWPAVLCVAIPSTLFAPLGARLNYVVPIIYLKYGFISMLLCTGLSLLW